MKICDYIHEPSNLASDTLSYYLNDILALSVLILINQFHLASVVRIESGKVCLRRIPSYFGRESTSYSYGF